MTPMPSGLSTRPESFAPPGESNLRLQRAIESLALNLDDELHRYRQARSGQGSVAPAPARLQLRQNRKPIDLIALKTTAAAAAAPPPPSNARLQELLGQSSVPSSQAYPPKTAVNQVRLSHGGTLTTYRPAPEDYLESTEALLGSLPHRPQPRQEEYPPSLLRQLTTPLGMGAFLLLLVGSASLGYVITSPQALSHLTDNAIARRLRGEPAPDSAAAGDGAKAGSQAEADFKPLGPDLSEKEFTSLDLSHISTLPSANTPPVTQSLPVQTQPGEPLSPGGDRTAAALPPVARPGVLTPAGARPNPAVLRAEIVAAPRAATPTQPSAVRPTPSAPATPPPALRIAPPAANAQPPQPLARDRVPASAAPAAPAAVAPPAPLTQAPPAANPSYYVVTDYTGASSLESARGVVGDAYVRNFSNGARIQMGAFSQESSARNLVNQLQNQGIPAQVITP
ncbi:SPOR domain-containing protein [Nodosilinea nodulosa]|uniref:SPOR domain-containing protein n=1 Tax=Nodosilinea nodulosa TaxID=416001 RepID=UPI000311352D|nr:SPOR domain-containing protein [Nodosilinea nodulosa]